MTERGPYSPAQLALYFLKLGSIGFGGPVALVGYMYRDLVERRHWIADEDYKEGLTLAQPDSARYGGTDLESEESPRTRPGRNRRDHRRHDFSRRASMMTDLCAGWCSARIEDLGYGSALAVAHLEDLT